MASSNHEFLTNPRFAAFARSRGVEPADLLRDEARQGRDATVGYIEWVRENWAVWSREAGVLALRMGHQERAMFDNWLVGGRRVDLVGSER